MSAVMCEVQGVGAIPVVPKGQKAYAVTHLSQGSLNRGPFLWRFQ